ncbi:MAG TPA: Gfo/Idh/MocA family oxidoreductase [Tepidisphaeraceae bacterium]|nr:Gfo/Idh/MocA family oxidoreductase [Tepidisphaeraceae bacterium]
MARLTPTRRQFVAGTVATGLSLWTSTRLRAAGANDDIRVAVVGINGRGGDHINAFSKIPGVRVVALCDADQAVLDRRTAELDKKGIKATGYLDIRQLLDSKEVDAIAIASPNHWHSLMTVWGCQAGKDVYCEKPVSHTIFEGRQCVNAAAKYNRIVMAGTQRRSDLGYHEAWDYIKKGNLGKILCARGFCYKPRPSIGKTVGPQPIPKTVNYDLWCGPAPMDPLRRKNLHYDWHWVWPTGNGDIGNQGIHEMDLCRWALGEPALAPRVYSFGGRFVVDDDATTPNTQVAVFDYPTAPLIFEVRGLPRKANEQGYVMDNYRGVRIGVVIQCENGYFAGGETGGWIYDNNNQRIRQFKQNGPEKHQANFIKAVRSRKQSDITAPIVEGHLSSALCHMANVSYRLGKTTPADQIAEQVKSNKQALDSLDRMKDHLAKNGMDLDRLAPNLGPVLTMNPQTEQFTGPLADQANKLATRDYRKPYEVPNLA